MLLYWSALIMPDNTLKERLKQVICYLKRQGCAGASVANIIESNPSFYEFGKDCSTRMAQRDLHVLEDLGYAKRISHLTWSIGDKPYHELDQKTAIAIKMLEVFGYILLDSKNTQHIKELFGIADTALESLAHYKNLRDKIVFKPWVAQRQKPVIKSEIYDVLVDAVLKEQKISFGYTNAQGVDKDRRTSPLGIFFYQDIAYMVGYDGDRISHYALHRISYIAPIKNAKIELPLGWKSLQHYVTHTSLLPAKNEECREQTVKIRFSNEYAVKNLKDAPFSDCEHSWEVDTNGSCVMTAQLLPNRELITWVLYYGRHAEIVEPAFLRDMMAVEVNMMAERYQPSPYSSTTLSHP